MGYQIRRRQPRLTHVTLMPGAIGAGDKAISGADLSLGMPRTETKEYETLLQTTFNVENAGKPPPGRKAKMTKEELNEYWGLDTPVQEGEAKRKQLMKELEKVKAKHKEVMAEKEEVNNEWQGIK